MSSQHATLIQTEQDSKQQTVSKIQDNDSVAKKLRLKRALDTSKSAVMVFMGPLQRHFGM